MFSALYASPTPGMIPVEAAPFMPMLLVTGIFLIFYVLLIRPQNQKIKKQQQEHAQMIEHLKKGDKVVTLSGIAGVISKASTSEFISLEIAKDISIEVTKQSIAKKREQA